MFRNSVWVFRNLWQVEKVGQVNQIMKTEDVNFLCLFLFPSTSYFYSILFYSILFYFILFYFILFYFILFYFILFYFILFYFILFYSRISP